MQSFIYGKVKLKQAIQMQQDINLENLEKKAYGTYRKDGLLDILLGSFVSLWAIAPLLSSSLGDFWSSMIFLPIWGLIFLVVRHIRLHVTIPRLGKVKYGVVRKRKIWTFTIVMLVINVLALGLGIFVSYKGSALDSSPVVWLGIAMFVGFSAAAYFLDFPRLFVYGIMVALSPIVGEWLYRTRDASHHGFPITFGVTSLIMILIGLYLFVRFLHNTPLPKESEREAVL
jgi:hypothetical protein